MQICPRTFAQDLYEKGEGTRQQNKAKYIESQKRCFNKYVEAKLSGVRAKTACEQAAHEIRKSLVAAVDLIEHNVEQAIKEEFTKWKKTLNEEIKRLEKLAAIVERGRHCA